MSFLMPVFVSRGFAKCQIFCFSIDHTNIVAAWLKSELAKFSSQVKVGKLTGDNTSQLKEKLLQDFKDGRVSVLVSTDVAGMGVDVPGLNLTVSVGLPGQAWQLAQQLGRCGRDGGPAINIVIDLPMPGRPVAESVRRAVRGGGCMRNGINSLFVLKNVTVQYTSNKPDVKCGTDCNLGSCVCSLCACCSSCADTCDCQTSGKEDQLNFILQFEDEESRRALEFYTKYLTSDDEESGEDEEGPGNEEAGDDREDEEDEEDVDGPEDGDSDEL